MEPSRKSTQQPQISSTISMASQTSGSTNNTPTPSHDMKSSAARKRPLGGSSSMTTVKMAGCSVANKRTRNQDSPQSTTTGPSSGHVSTTTETQPVFTTQVDLQDSPNNVTTHSMATGSNGPDPPVTPQIRRQFTTTFPPTRRSASPDITDSTPILDIAAMNRRAPTRTGGPTRRSRRVRKPVCYSEVDVGSSQQQEFSSPVESTEKLVKSLIDMDTKMMKKKTETVSKIMHQLEAKRLDDEESEKLKDEALSVAWETKEKLKNLEAEKLELQRELCVLGQVNSSLNSDKRNLEVKVKERDHQLAKLEQDLAASESAKENYVRELEREKMLKNRETLSVRRLEERVKDLKEEMSKKELELVKLNEKIIKTTQLKENEEGEVTDEVNPKIGSTSRSKRLFGIASEIAGSPSTSTSSGGGQGQGQVRERKGSMEEVGVKCLAVAVQQPVVKESSGGGGEPGDWTTEEVISALVTVDRSMENYAELFRKHEIDGEGMLLLNSDMMMKHMGLKLVPALHICSIISKLLTNLTSYSMFWGE